MEQSSKSDTNRENQHYFNIISITIVSLMMLCIGVSINEIGRRLISSWPMWLLPTLSFLVSLERMITYNRFTRMVFFSKTWLVFQATQWIVILSFIKVVLLIAFPPESWAVEFQLWRLNFFGNFFNVTYVYLIFFGLIIWAVSGYFASLLHEMSLDETIVRYETSITVPVNETPVRERLIGIVFLIGFVLLSISAILRINIRVLIEEGFATGRLIQPFPNLAAGAWNVLLYFIFGLILMSFTQFARLNARWTFQKIEVIPKLAKKWAVYSIGFILLIAIITSLMPTNYSLGLLSSIAQILSVVYGIVIFIFSLLFSLLIFLIGLLANILGIAAIEQGERPPQEFVIPELPVQLVGTGANPWWELIKSILFWLVFLSLVGFSLITFIRQHGEYLQSVNKIKIISWLKKTWSYIKSLFKDVNQKLSIMIESGLEVMRSNKKSKKEGKFSYLFQYRKLNNRQRILFTFFTMMKRSGKKGVERKKSQTPYEYAHKLEETIPQTEREINVITEEFIRARYSTVEVDDERVSLIRQYWEVIRNALNFARK